MSARRNDTAKLVCALTLAWAAVSLATPSAAGPLGAWVEAGAVLGASSPDASLADYQWDVSPHPAWGAQAMAGLGGKAIGLRWSRSSTTQALGDGASVPSADVSLTAIEVVARAQVLRVAAARMYATGTAGRLHLGYDPDQVTIDVPGSGPVDVALAPVNTWAWGGGLGVEHPLGTRFTGALEVTRRVFSLETAHRNGGAIETGEQGFAEWNARFVLGWRIRT